VNLKQGEETRPNIYSYGMHPWFIDEKNWRDEIRNLEMKVLEKRCLAVGECGLDKLSKVNFDVQLEVFTEHIHIANSVKKPLIVHCVKAFNELINCLNLNDNKVPVIIHGFNNNESIARVLLDHGCLFSFGKALIKFESNAAKVIKNIGRKNFFLETDDSDISIKYIYHKASELLGIEEEVLKEQVQNNFESIFKIKK
jgi:TatD DNase family protein